MKLFTCNDHKGHWPVGVGSVVVAENEDRARELLDAALVLDGLEPNVEYPYTLVKVSLDREDAYILTNGDY